MRFLEWGKADSHDADFAAREGASESLLVWGNGRDFDYGGSTVVDLFYVVRNKNNPVTGVRFCVVKVALENIKAKIGIAPVILKATFAAIMHEQGNVTTTSYPLRRLFAPASLSALTGRYMDSGVPWTDDVYAPLPGTDVADADYSSATVTTTDTAYYPFGKDYATAIEWRVDDLLAEALRFNSDLRFILWAPSNNNYANFNWDYEGVKRLLRIWYLHRLEFFGVDSNGDLDPGKLLESVSGDLASQLYLGAVQRGQTSTPASLRIKNFGEDVLPLVEVWDDSPEWSDPVQIAGTGTGALDHVILSDSAVSQKYTVVFTSSTDFEVVAEGYRDNPTGLHPTQDANPSWVGNTASDWSAPSGGLTIPSAAWTAGTLVGDQFLVYVTGQSTDASWPADSNSQVECCLDDGAGNPDGKWRSVLGQRTKLTAGVTIDAVTKTVSVRYIDTSKWDVGDRVWIGDGTNLDEGTIQSATATSVTIENLTVSNNVYAAGARVCTTLPIQNLGTTPWSQVDQDSGASQSPASRLYVEDPSVFAASDKIVVVSYADGSVYETATVAAVSTGGGYLDLAANLTLDWTAGDLVYKVGAGEARVWFRVVGSALSQEELKQLRINVRT